MRNMLVEILKDKDLDKFIEVLRLQGYDPKREEAEIAMHKCRVMQLNSLDSARWLKERGLRLSYER